MVLRGPTRAGKSTLARRLEGQSPDRFVVVASDNPPSHPNNRIAQVGLWGQLVREQWAAGQNVLLDCDLQAPWEATQLMLALGLPRPDSDVLIIRLSVPLEAALSRRSNLTPAEVAHYHQCWNAPPIAGELQLDTNGKDPGEVMADAIQMIRGKWPRSVGR